MSHNNMASLRDYISLARPGIRGMQHFPILTIMSYHKNWDTYILDVNPYKDYYITLGCMTTLYTGLMGSNYLDEAQKSDLLRYIEAWLGSRERKFQQKSQTYYDGAQNILDKKRRFKNANGDLVTYPELLPNTKFVYNLYRKIIDQKAMFISERKLRFISLPSHPVSYDDPDSVNADSVGDIKPAEGYEVVEVGEYLQIKNTSADELTKNNKFLSTLDKLFNKDWYVKMHKAITYCLIDGDCWLYPYITEDGDFDVRVFRGSEVCPIYTDESNTTLAAVARWYQIHKPNPNTKKEDYVEIYRRDNMLRYKIRPGQGTNEPDYLAEGITSNYIRIDNSAESAGEPSETYRWKDIPFIHIVAHDPPVPLLVRCKSQLDALNRIYSNWVDNTLTYPDGGILIVQNAMETEPGAVWEQVATNRVLKVVSTQEMPGGDVKFLENPVKAEDYVAITTAIRAAIYDSCAAFDDTNPNILSSHLQELTLRMTMMSMEQDANILIESYEAAIARLINDYYCPFLIMKKFPDYSDQSVGVKVGDVRVRNIAELTNLMVSMGLRMSKRTMLEQHPWPIDPEEEQERILNDINLDLLSQQILVQQQANIQEDMAEKQHDRQMELNEQQAKLNPKPMGGGGFGDKSGTSSFGDKQIGAGAGNKPGSVNTGSPNGGGKSADLKSAADKKAKDDKAGGKPQPQR